MMTSSWQKLLYRNCRTSPLNGKHCVIFLMPFVMLSASCGTLRDNVRGWYGAAVRYRARYKGNAGTDIPSRHLSPAISPSLQSVHRHNVDKSSSSPYLRAASIAVSFSNHQTVVQSIKINLIRSCRDAHGNNRDARRNCRVKCSSLER